jgi:RNA polymerase sigma factor (TIGR02999 family)
MCTTASVTKLVREYADGEKASLDALIPLIYAELRRMAQRYLRREQPSHTLQPTALVNEMYLRLAGQNPVKVRDRVHFFAVASHVMRQVLIDHARTKFREKRGGRQEKLSINEAQDACLEKPAIVVRIDDALNQLARIDPRKARLVEMRFFGGVTAEESASVLGLPVQTVRRELRVAQAWLQRELDWPSNTASGKATLAS